MAKLETTLRGDFHRILDTLENRVMNASYTASLEDQADYREGTARCSVRVFERYSYMGGNRVSMNLTLFQAGPDSPVRLVAITAGGSQAMFFKLNTWGEEAFLDTLREAIRDL